MNRDDIKVYIEFAVAKETKDIYDATNRLVDERMLKNTDSIFKRIWSLEDRLDKLEKGDSFNEILAEKTLDRKARKFYFKYGLDKENE